MLRVGNMTKSSQVVASLHFHSDKQTDFNSHVTVEFLEYFA